MRRVVLGILLCVLPGSVRAEPTPKNVLLLFTNFGQRTDFLDLFEASLRARTPGPITFYEASLEEPQGVTDRICRARRIHFDVDTAD